MHQNASNSFIQACSCDNSVKVSLNLGLNNPLNVERLSNGNTLIAEYPRVMEVTSNLDIVWERSWTHATDMERLPNGSTLITRPGVYEYAPGAPVGDPIWSYTAGLAFIEDVERVDGGGAAGPINTSPVARCENVTVEAGLGCVVLEADASIDDESYDPDEDPITITQDPAGPYPLGDTLVTLTVSDGQDSATCTATVTVEDTTPPLIVVATVAPQLVEVGQTVNFDGVVVDECNPTDPAVEWDFGDGDTSTIIDATHPYAAPGVYTATLTVTDSSENGSTEEFMVVVYDPTGGFVTGGGWIWSPEGACAFDSTLEGKANFGFVSKYKKGANVPTGNTAFVFDVAEFEFHSSSYEWLVVTGSDYARFKGTGTINDAGAYKFMLWAKDGGKGGVDEFRIRIWDEDESGNETDIYDNGFDQAIGGGSIIVHAK